MNLLDLFCCCFVFLAFPVLLIEGNPQHGGKGRENSVTSVTRRRSRRTSHPVQHGVYEETFQANKIEYMTEDNDPGFFGAGWLRDRRGMCADSVDAKRIRPSTYWNWDYAPEVFWAFNDLEAFASLKVPHKEHKFMREYYHPFYYGYIDETFDEVPGLHQVTAPLSTRDKPYSYMCCSVFVRIVPTETPDISKAYCGHPVCYAATRGMTYRSKWGQWTCRPPPIRGQPSETWGKHLCQKLYISN